MNYWQVDSLDPRNSRRRIRLWTLPRDTQRNTVRHPDWLRIPMDLREIGIRNGS